MTLFIFLPTLRWRCIGRRGGKVKMADLSGTELSEEKEAETELKKRQKRPWEDLHKSGKIDMSPELPETLGFYDISVVRREQREHSAGNRQVASNAADVTTLTANKRLQCSLACSPRTLVSS